MRFVRSFNIDVLQGMDIGFSHKKSPVSGVIRFATAFRDGLGAAFNALFDRDFPNHTLFLTTAHRQFSATEMKPRGIVERPLDVYRGRRNRIVRIYRWRGFDDPAVRSLAEEYMATLLRRGKEGGPLRYDLPGAIASSALGQRLFPNAQDNPKRDYCSENVLEVLRMFGCPGPYPARDNPMELMEWMEWMERGPGQFRTVTDWERPR